MSILIAVIVSMCFGVVFSYVESKPIRSGVTTFITYLAVYFACKYVFGI
jgi:hypothetical protein